MLVQEAEILLTSLGLLTSSIGYYITKAQYVMKPESLICIHFLIGNTF